MTAPVTALHSVDRLDAPPPARAEGAVASRRVFLRNLTLSASVGVYAHERSARQPLVISVTLDIAVGRERVDGAAASEPAFSPPPRPNDPEAASVLCYDQLSQRIRATVEDGHIDYVETVCDEIGALCLSDGRVLEAWVRVEKPAAIADADSAGVEAVYRRSRDA